jgi:MarR family transcriptional regulator for hemolysin
MTLVEQVASVRRAIHRLLTRRLSRRTDRPFTQMLALKAVARGDASSQVALAERLLVDAPATSRLVDRLVEDGLLKRTAGEDRRCVRLEATEAGRAEVQCMLTELDRLDGELRQHLTAPEVKQLHQLLEKLHAGVLKAGEAPAGDGEQAG